MPNSPSIWTGENFERAITEIENGTRLTSRQWNSLANRINQGITSGQGDILWRTLWSIHSGVRDFSRRTFANFYASPRSDEWFLAHSAIDVEGVPSAVSYNPHCPLWVFRDGFPGYNNPKTGTARGEQARFGTTGNLPNGMAVSLGSSLSMWNAMKSRRGTISIADAADRARGCRTTGTGEDARHYEVKDQDLHGFTRDSICYNAREILTVPRRIAGSYGWLKTYGGRIVPASPKQLACGDETDPETPVANPDNPDQDTGYPDVPNPPEFPGPINPGEGGDDGDKDIDDVEADFRDDDYLTGSQSVGPAYDYFSHERGFFFEAMMNSYLSEFRGLSESRPGLYRIKETAFDFDRFYTSQYLFAPARADRQYPALSSTWLESHERFVIAGVMVHGTVEEDTDVPIQIELRDREGVVSQRTFNLRLSAGESSAHVYLPSGAVRRIRAVGALPNGVSGEVAEIFTMRPKLYDAYALLRLRQPAILVGKINAKTYSDDYFRTGACLGGAFLDANPDETLSSFPTYETTKKFINSFARVSVFDRLIGYEVVTEQEENDDGEMVNVEKSVMYFRKGTLGPGDNEDLDMWIGMYGNRKSTATTRGQTTEWAFQIGGNCGATSTNPSSSTIYKTQAYAQIRGAFANPMYAFAETLAAPRYTSRREGFADGYLKWRRRNFAQFIRGIPRDDLGVGRYMLWAESPSGLNYRYQEDPITQGIPSGEWAQAYYRSAQMHQAPYLIDEIESLSDEDFDAKFPSGVIADAGISPNVVVQRGKVVRVKLAGRLRRTERMKTTAVANTGASWNAYSADDRFRNENDQIEDRFQCVGERSDENRIIEMCIDNWQTGQAKPPRRFGDFAPSALVGNSVPTGMSGSVYARYFFMKLIPRVYEDGNDVQQRTDTRVFAHLFQQAEYVIRSAVGAFFDTATNGEDNFGTTGSGKNTFCHYLFPPRDYTMESLLTKRAADGPAENFAMRRLGEGEGLDRIDGIPVPNLAVTSGVLVEYAKAINSLTACSLPGNSTVYARVSSGDRRRIEIDDPKAPLWDGVVGRLAVRGGIPSYYQPIFGPKDTALPGTPTGSFYPPGLRFGDDYPDECFPDGQTPAARTCQFWDDGTTGSTSIFASKDARVAGDETNLRWNAVGNGRDAEWAAVGQDDFMHAFAPLMREYIIKNSLGRPTLEIIELHIQTGWTTEEREFIGTSTGRPYTLTHAVGLPLEDAPLIIGRCRIRTGGSLSAPALPTKVPAIFNFGGRRPVNRTGDRYWADGAHRSELRHNIGGGADAVLVIGTEGEDEFGDPECELIPSGLISPDFYYEVKGGAGIRYARPNLTDAPDSDEDYFSYPDGAIFFGVQYGTGLSLTPVRDYTQVDADDPSEVCLRRDLGTR